MTSLSTLITTFDTTAYGIAEQGIDAFDASVEQLVRTARRHCLSPVLSDVLADRGSPPVARERAFGMLLADLAVAAERRHTAVLAA